jgi:hypothetical protein
MQRYKKEFGIWNFELLISRTSYNEELSNDDFIYK